MNFFQNDDRVMVAHVPQKGVHTIYPSIGDTIVCVLDFIGYSRSVSIFRLEGKVKETERTGSTKA